jgi:hypothetical protein
MAACRGRAAIIRNTTFEMRPVLRTRPTKCDGYYLEHGQRDARATLNTSTRCSCMYRSTSCCCACSKLGTRFVRAVHPHWACAQCGGHRPRGVYPPWRNGFRCNRQPAKRLPGATRRDAAAPAHVHARLGARAPRRYVLGVFFGPFCSTHFACERVRKICASSKYFTIARSKVFSKLDSPGDSIFG